MLRDSAVTLLKSRLRRSSDTALTNDIITEFQATQERLEHAVTLPWFLVQDDASRQLTIGNETFATPTGFLRAYEDGGALWYRENATDKWIQIGRDDYDAIYNRYGITAGAPKKYSLEGTNYKIGPIPDKAYYMRTKAYVKDTVLSANIENNWLANAGDLLLAETGVVIASFYLRNSELAGEMKQWASAARTVLFAADLAWKSADRSYQMGDE